MPDHIPTDRERVELMLPSLLLAAAVRDARAADGDDLETRNRLAACERDLDQEIAAVLPKERTRARKLHNRGKRIEKRVLAPCRGADFGAFVLAIRLLIERLIAEGHIVLHAQSSFDQAWGRFTDGLAESPEADKLDTPERRGAADRLYRQMREKLAEHGYYRTTEAA
jgi:hypothetical protein